MEPVQRPWPALPLAVGFVLGVALALQRPPSHSCVAVVLLGLAIALHGPLGRAVAGLAVGLVWPLVAGLPADDLAARLQPDRSVEVVGRVASHWRRGTFGWLVDLEVNQIEQGGRRWHESQRVTLSLASAAEPPGLGSELLVQGHLRRSAGYWNLAPTPPGRWLLTVKSPRLVRAGRPPPLWARTSTRLRRWLLPAIQLAPMGEGRELARALVLGDRSGLASETLRGLRRLGLSHLLAVSGLHVGLVGGFAFLVLLRAPRLARLAGAALCIALYVLLVGPSASVLRSALMAGLAMLALALRRPPSVINTLALATLTLVAADPRLVLDLGFQLTVGATVGLLLLAPPLARRWAHWPWRAGSALAATLGAQLATLPAASPAFHLLTPGAPLANLLLVPWAGALLLADLAWCALAALVPAAGAALRWVPEVMAWPLLRLAGWSGSEWFAIPVLLSPGAALVLAAVLYGQLVRGNRLTGLCLLASLLGGVPATATGHAELVVLDVGQGDAILLRDGGRAVLVDGGGWARGDFAATVLVPALLAEGVHRLDAVLLTHDDRDHCGGLLELVGTLPVRTVWVAPPPASLGESCASLLAAKALQAHRRPVVGDQLRAGRWLLTVLKADVPRGTADNDSSVVVRAEAAGLKVLLTGDLEAAGERELLAELGSGLGATVLKVGHHGSRSSTTSAFLAAVQPRVAVISAGRGNRYGHPAAQVVERLQATGATVLRTDREGCLRVQVTDLGKALLDVCGAQ